jgi:hypothetical protein
MRQLLYRYAFNPDISIEEVEVSLLLALLAVESLHGETQTCLDTAHAFDAGKRACVIDATTAVGRDLARLFTGFLRREFGDTAFRVERLGAPLPRARKAPAAAAG